MQCAGTPFRQCSSHAQRHAASRPLGPLAQKGPSLSRAPHVQQAADTFTRKAQIPTQHLVRALPVQGNGYATLLRSLIDAVLRIDAGAAKRLTLGPDHVVQIPRQLLRGHNDLTGHSAHMTVHEVRPLLLIQLTARGNIGERVDGIIGRHMSHGTDHRRRIHTTRKRRAQRHIAAQMQADALQEILPDALGRLFKTQITALDNPRRPPALGRCGHPSRQIDHQHMPSRQLQNAFKEGFLITVIDAIDQIVVSPLPVGLCLRRLQCQQRWRL